MFCPFLVKAKDWRSEQRSNRACIHNCTKWTISKLLRYYEICLKVLSHPGHCRLLFERGTYSLSSTSANVHKPGLPFMRPHITSVIPKCGPVEIGADFFSVVYQKLIQYSHRKKNNSTLSVSALFKISVTDWDVQWYLQSLWHQLVQC